MDYLKSKARGLILESKYLSLATCSNNIPWISPLWYAVSDKYIFYFISDLNSVHAQSIKDNPKVAFTIFNSNEKPSEVNGLQVSANCYEVGISGMLEAIRVIFSKSGSELFRLRFKEPLNPKSYLEFTNFRIFKLVPDKFYMLDTEISETDTRIEVIL